MAKRSRARWEQAHVEGRRWQEGDAHAAVAMWRQSGLSIAAFARQHGVSAQRLGWWRRKLDEGDDGDQAATAEPESLRLAPVRLRGLGFGCAVAVALPTGTRLEIHDPCAVPVSWLSEVVQMLLGDER